MQLTKRIAIAAGALTLGTAGIAAAGSPPDNADEGLTKASAQVGIELPASQESHPQADEHADDSDDLEVDEDEVVEVEDELEAEDEADDEDELDEGIGPVDNHGAEVSAVAKSDETEGREHGIAVSEVARQGHGKGPAGESSTTHGRP